MLLSLFHPPVTVELLGETEANSAGEQTAEGYPAGAHRDDGLGVGSSIPTLTFTPPHRIDRPLHAFLNSRPKGGTNSEWAPSKVAIISGTKWPYFPEPASHTERIPTRELIRRRMVHASQVCPE